MKKPAIKADILLIGGIVLAGLILAAVLFFCRRTGGRVQVRVSGQTVGEYALNEDRTVEIEGADGGTNTMTIENGQAWMSEASCPDGLCMNMGHIRYKGQSVICLPNQVVLEIVSGKTDENAPDVISGGKQ